MADIDPNTGIDYDAAYDDPAMVAIRNKLQAAGAQMHGSRVVGGLSPEDARAIARAQMAGTANATPGDVSRKTEAIMNNPSMVDTRSNDFVANILPKLQVQSPEAYQRITGGPNGVPQDFQQPAPTATEPSAKAPPRASTPNEAPSDAGAMPEAPPVSPVAQTDGGGNDAATYAAFGLLAAVIGTAAAIKLYRSRGWAVPNTPDVANAAAQVPNTATAKAGPGIQSRTIVAAGDDVVNDVGAAKGTKTIEVEAPGEKIKDAGKAPPGTKIMRYDEMTPFEAPVKPLEEPVIIRGTQSPNMDAPDPAVEAVAAKFKSPNAKPKQEEAKPAPKKKNLTDNEGFRENMAEEARDRKRNKRAQDEKRPAMDMKKDDTRSAVASGSKGELQKALLKARRGGKGKGK